MLNSLIPQLYRRLRERRKLTQKELARRLGKCKQTLIAWEKGHTRPKQADEALLLETLACTPQEFVEVWCGILSDFLGVPVAVQWDDERPAPSYPLTHVEQLFKAYEGRLPARLENAIQVLLSAARTRDYHHQQEAQEVREIVLASIDAVHGDAMSR